MKLLYIALSGLLLCRFAAVQAMDPEAVAGDARAKHLAVVTEQRRLEAVLSRQEIDCHKKFAVNTCLDNISLQRRNAMAILQQEENLLKDAERKERGVQQIRKTGEKSLPDKSRGGTVPRTESARQYQGLSASAENKDQHRNNVVESAADARRAFEERLLANRHKAQARIDLEAGAAEKARKFQKRQDESLARRLQHEAGQAERNNSPSKSLPLPQPQ